MKDWKEYWEKFWIDYPARAENDEYLIQVGKTIEGVQITQKQFHAIVKNIDTHLNINNNDKVLDLCCGNGLISIEIAKNCREVVGIDYSEILINKAKEISQTSNVKYYQKDIRKLNELKSINENIFTKVLWYEALAFFDGKDLYEILHFLINITTKDSLILIGSVLDYDRKWNFFNTFKRKFNYIFRIVILGQEVGLGKWWKRSEIEKICESLNLQCEFHYQNDILHTAHYRFDVKIYK